MCEAPFRRKKCGEVYHKTLEKAFFSRLEQEIGSWGRSMAAEDLAKLHALAAAAFESGDEELQAKLQRALGGTNPRNPLRLT